MTKFKKRINLLILCMMLIYCNAKSQDIVMHELLRYSNSPASWSAIYQFKNLGPKPTGNFNFYVQLLGSDESQNPIGQLIITMLSIPGNTNRTKIVNLLDAKLREGFTRQDVIDIEVIIDPKHLLKFNKSFNDKSEFPANTTPFNNFIIN